MILKQLLKCSYLCLVPWTNFSLLEVVVSAWIYMSTVIKIKNKLLLLFLNAIVAARWCYIQRVVN